MKRFLLLFFSVFVLTIIFHPKPICSFSRMGTSCSPTYFPFSWLTLQPEFHPVYIEGRLPPNLEIVTIEERFMKPEVIFDAFIAVLISFFTVIVFIILKKRVLNLSKKRIVSISAIFVLLMVWTLVISLFAIPYYVTGANSSGHTVFFKPFTGGVE